MSELVAIAAVLTPFAVSGARLLDKLLGRSCEVAGNMMADQIYVWQWTNRVNFAHKAVKIMERDKIAARVLPAGFLLPLLENAGNVDDDEVQTLWANLLASAAEDESACEPSYIHVLRSLSKRDARLLLRISRSRIKAKSVDAPTLEQCECWPLPEEEMKELGFTNSRAFWESIDRLRDLISMKPAANEWIALPGEVRNHTGFLVTSVQG